MTVLCGACGRLSVNFGSVLILVKITCTLLLKIDLATSVQPGIRIIKSPAYSFPTFEMLLGNFNNHFSLDTNLSFEFTFDAIKSTLDHLRRSDMSINCYYVGKRILEIREI